MTFPRAVLWLSALAWAGFGVWLFAFPASLDGVGVALTGPAGRVEIRAFYGGLELGLAGFLAWAALDPARFRPGLVAGALAVGGAGTGRLVGLLLEGGGPAVHWTFAAIELSAAALTLVALARLGRAARGPA